MKRRIFIKNSLSASLAPLFITGIGGQKLNASVLPASFNPNIEFQDRCMVILYMAGGNDIINMSVPLNTISTSQFGEVDQYSAYEGIRQQTGIPFNDLIDMRGFGNSLNTDLGLHPSMQSISDLYQNEKFKFIQRVGYQQVNGSHFSAESILLRGVDGTNNAALAKSGWVGRFLQDSYPAYKGIPFAEQPDPLGVVMSNPLKLGFHTAEEHQYEMNLTNQNPGSFYNVISSVSGDRIGAFNGETCVGEMLQHAELVEKSTLVYSQRIQCVFDRGFNNPAAKYPTKTSSDDTLTSLAAQLKTVARLLRGGSKTKIFMVSIGGFDTHANQVEQNKTTTGKHAELLRDVADSLKAFQDDLSFTDYSGKSLSQNVLTVAFSEFGRKIRESGFGTDHGTISTMFLMGDSVTPGVLGDNVNLVDTAAENSDVNIHGAPSESQVQFDYRMVYAKVLQQWFGANCSSLNNTFNIDEMANNQINFSDWSNPYLNNNTFPDLLNLATIPENCVFPPPPATPHQAIEFTLNLKVFLEGYFYIDNQSNPVMTTNGFDHSSNTNSNNKILPALQPFSPLFFYGGNETVGIDAEENPIALPTNIVDWLYIEIWDSLQLCDEPINNKLVVAKKAVLLKNDGSIVDTAGNSVVFDGFYPGNYKVAVYHKSHLAVLSSESFSLSGIDCDTNDSDLDICVDLSQSENAVTGKNQLKAVDTSNQIFAMIAGDVDQNGVINNKDHNLIRQDNNSLGYKITDLNGDKTVNGNDLDLWKDNKSKIGEPLIHKSIK